MLINKAYIFRLYPTNEQKELINKCIGSSRFVYNYYLNKKEKEYKENSNSLSLSEMKKDIKKLIIECPNCGSENDRDINVSINILGEGIRLYYKRILN